MGSPKPHGYLARCLPTGRSEADVRAVRARRALLEANLISDGVSPGAVARLATPEVAEKMLAHEARVFDLVASLFGNVGAGLK